MMKKSGSCCGVLLVVLVVLACAAVGTGDPDYEIKRYPKFMAFPRVGRMGHKSLKIGLSDGIEKRNDPKTGIWFGPRLGRTLSERKIEFGDNLPWAYIIFSENPLQNFLRSEEEISEHAETTNDSLEPKGSSYVDSA